VTRAGNPRKQMCAHCAIRPITRGIHRHCQHCYNTVPVKFLDVRHGDHPPGPEPGSLLGEVCELACLEQP
jgi:hypothetical protein